MVCFQPDDGFLRMRGNVLH